MKTAIAALIILLGVALCLPPAASAATLPLTNTGISGATLEAIITGPAISSISGSPMTWVDGTAGTVDSAVFPGTGAVGDYFVYTYRVNVNPTSTSPVKVLTTPFLGNILDLGSGPFSFFIISSLGAGDLFNFYGFNGTVGPSASQRGDTPGNEVFREIWLPSGIGAGLSSAIFGVFSLGEPTLVTANALGGTGGTTADPTVVSASPVPEPGTLLLLGSGLSGLATWGWRRRKKN